MSYACVIVRLTKRVFLKIGLVLRCVAYQYKTPKINDIFVPCATGQKGPIYQHMQKVITLREKAAVYALVSGVLETWTDCYVVAMQDHEDITRRRAGLATMVARWKSRQDIKDLFLNAQRYYLDKDAAAVERWKRENPTHETGGNEDAPGVLVDNVRTDNKTPGNRKTVDYTNPENQARKLNELVNRADNTGEALDALKVIIQTQKADRDAARDGRQVRAYVPIGCNDCPLYQRAAQGTKKG